MAWTTVDVFNDIKALDSWLERVEGDRYQTEETWEQISENLFGIRSFKTQHTPGRDRSFQLYDTTALFANQLLAGALHGMLTNPTGVWLEMLPVDLKLLDDYESRQWFEDSRNRMLQVFNSTVTGFTTNIAELYLDIPGFGMGNLWVEPHPKNVVQFSARPLRECFIETNDMGQVDVVFRKVKLTARQFALRFPNPTGGHPKEVVDALEKGQGEKCFEVCQFIGKSNDPMAGKSAFNKPWRSKAWYRGGKDGLTEIETQQYDEMPLLTPRWSVDTGECYGRGPGWVALADGKMLNAMYKTILKAAMKATDPPLLVSDQAVLSDIRTHPGGVNYVQDRPGIGGQADAIRPLDNRARVDIGIEMLDRKSQAVRNAFWAHILQMHEDPRMTATQVMALSTQAQRMMAPMLGRLQQELLEPLVDRVFGIMMRGKWFRTPPAALRGRKVRMSYVSPLSRSQRASEAQSIMATWQQAAMIAQAGQDPDALQVLDASESVRCLAEANAVPLKVVRDVREIQERQAARAELAQEDRALAQAGAGADMLQKLVGAAGQAEELAQAA